jgi:hypothetical protein
VNYSVRLLECFSIALLAVLRDMVFLLHYLWTLFVLPLRQRASLPGSTAKIISEVNRQLVKDAEDSG